MQDVEFGYDKDRFTNLNSDQFDCIICSNIVKDPKECSGCGSLFCASCIDSWLVKKKECPNRCDTTKNQIQKIQSKALLRIYNDLDIKCKFTDKCKKIIKISELENHEKTCQLPKCINYDICGNNSKPEFGDKKVCDISCQLLVSINKCGNNQKEIYNTLKNFFADYSKQIAVVPYQQNNQQVPVFSSIKNVINSDAQIFKWSEKNRAQGIEIINNGSGVWLKEQAYMFRSIVSDQPFRQVGVYYWEIVADDRTENELKIGVATQDNFNFNSAFCDYEYGFAFYGLGQLRHNSNASGPQYGKRFKKEGVLGCCLNMPKGQLSFSLNNEFLGIAFTSELLKKPPIYLAVSLLHCAGCQVTGNKPVPSIFPL